MLEKPCDVSELVTFGRRRLLFLEFLFPFVVCKRLSVILVATQRLLRFGSMNPMPFSWFAVEITWFTYSPFEPHASRSDLMNLWSKPICRDNPLSSHAVFLGLTASQDFPAEEKRSLQTYKTTIFLVLPIARLLGDLKIYRNLKLVSMAFS